MKTCTRCGAQKPLDEFHNCKSKADGKFSACKQCRNTYNMKKAKEIGHDVLYQRTLDKMGADEYKARRREYYLENKDAVLKRVREWRKRNPDGRKNEYKNNKDAALKRSKKWVAENPEKRKQVARDYAKRFYKDPKNRPAIISRKLLSRVLALTGGKSGTRTEKALGYTQAELKAHLERNFSDGMTWDNHGEWHVDHIIPVSGMVALGVTCLKKINALKNLRPVWASENLKKHASFVLASVKL